MATSRDGIRWKRADRRPYVALGLDGTGDGGTMYMGVGMLRSGQRDLPVLRRFRLYALGRRQEPAWGPPAGCDPPRGPAPGRVHVRRRALRGRRIHHASHHLLGGPAGAEHQRLGGGRGQGGRPRCAGQPLPGIRPGRLRPHRPQSHTEGGHLGRQSRPLASEWERRCGSGSQCARPSCIRSSSKSPGR